MSTLERPPAGTNRSVPPVRVLAISYRVILRQLTSRGRIIALTLLAMVSSWPRSLSARPTPSSTTPFG